MRMFISTDRLQNRVRTDNTFDMPLSRLAQMISLYVRSRHIQHKYAQCVILSSRFQFRAMTYCTTTRLRGSLVQGVQILSRNSEKWAVLFSETLFLTHARHNGREIQGCMQIPSVKILIFLMLLI